MNVLTALASPVSGLTAQSLYFSPTRLQSYSSSESLQDSLKGISYGLRQLAVFQSLLQSLQGNSGV